MIHQTSIETFDYLSWIGPVLVDCRNSFLDADISEDVVETLDHEEEETEQNNYRTSDQENDNLKNKFIGLGKK
jgi:hypothetical protein